MGIFSLDHFDVINLILRPLLREILHNRQSSRPRLLAEDAIEVHVRVLLLTLHHLDIAGHVVFTALLGELLDDRQGSVPVLVLSCWLDFHVVDVGATLHQIDISSPLLLRLFLREILHDRQGRMLIFLQLLQSSLIRIRLTGGLPFDSGLNILVDSIIDQDEVFLLFLISALL